MGHGSQYHRGVGSLGTMRPMRVLKGKNLPGHMGHELITVQNLEVIDILLDKNIILVKGNVPGPKKSLVIIKSAIKHEGKVNNMDELVTYVTEEPVVEETTTEVAEETAVETPNEIANEESSQESSN
jgi:large subunit ribosomal protein L3